MSQQPKIKGVADIVFLLDATGSMAPCINAVKDNVEAFITSLTSKGANNHSFIKDWRTKVVGYRDYDYISEGEPYVDNPFVESVETLRSQLSKLEAKGGGDEPESLLEGLYQLASMPATERGAQLRPDAWRHRGEARRFIIVFTDAPYKEPMKEPRGGTVNDVINALIQNKIVLHLFAPDLPCFQPLSEVDKAEWNVVSGGANPQDSLAKFTADKENFRQILQQLAKTITIESEVPAL